MTFVLTTMLALVKPRVLNKDRAYFVKKFEKNGVRKNVTRTNFLTTNVIRTLPDVRTNAAKDKCCYNIYYNLTN